MTAERRKTEFALLRQRYGDLGHGENFDWVIFKDFRLPAGWNRDTTELLVVIPAGYPTTPPDNFFVRNELRISDGSMPANYSDNQSVLGSSWAQFSFHAKEWNPSTALEDGDSLLTFMLAVEQRLRERN